MRKSIYILLTLVLGCISCENFLDSELLTEKTTENFPATETEAQEMVTAIYAHLLFESPETSSGFYIAQLASDECLGGNLSYSNNCATNFLMYKDNLNGLSGLWNRCYTLINRANSAISNIDNVTSWSTQTERDRLVGESYYLRAIAYYELVQIFGGVPLRTEAMSTNTLPRASIDEVYTQIASDLKNAINLMPNQIYVKGSSMAGHATKYAAEAMMARVFLFYTGRYAKEALPDGTSKADVIEWIDDCVYNSGHDLVSDQRNLWAYTNQVTEDNSRDLRYQYVTKNNLVWVGNSSVETLFANKHNLKSNWSYTWWSNTCAQFFSPSGDNYDQAGSYPFGSGWGAGPVSPAMINEWQEWSKQQTYTDGFTEDPRLTGSVWSYTAMDPNNEGNVLMDCSLDESEPPYTVSYRYYEQTGFHQKKYININACNENGNIEAFGKVLYPGITTQTSQQLLQIADLIHIRFADVLLMQSELKEDAEGLNRVRARSHLAPVSYSLEAIKNERRWELCFEAIRWWDMLRWSGPSLEEAGDLLNKQAGFNVINAAEVKPMVQFDYKKRLQETQGYWPIPQTEVDLTNGIIEQNPGWDPTAQFTDWNNM